MAKLSHPRIILLYTHYGEGSVLNLQFDDSGHMDTIPMEFDYTLPYFYLDSD